MSKSERKDYLREQVNGSPLSEYKLQLIEAYNYIKKQVHFEKNQNFYTINLGICDTIYKDRMHIANVSVLIHELCSLGYIEIVGSGTSRVYAIKKELDI